MPTIARINELPIIQGNHTPGDSISLGKNVLKVTVRNQPSSGANAYVSWNVSDSKINELEPGESVSYFMDGNILDGNELYVSFDDAASNGKALVSIFNDTLKDC